MDSLAAAAVAQPPTRCSTKCVPVLAASETPRLDEASEPQRRPWEDLPADIIGVVVRRLPLLEDRARLRSVCHAWRAAARLHRRLLPPPLPLLVLSDFSFSSLRAAEGTMTGWRRRVPLPETETAAAASVSAGSSSSSVVRCVGSFDGWLVGVERAQSRELGDLRCFLTNPFSHGVVRLPPPSAAAHPGDDDESIRSLPIANGSGVVMNCATSTAQPSVMSFCKVILSSSPDTSTDDCVVAAMSMAKSATKLALWRPGMESWCVCYGSCVGKFFDVIFCQGKLYMFNCGELSEDLFSFGLSEDDGSGLIVSRVERRVMELPQVTAGYQQDWSIVEWRGKILIVAAYTGDADVWQRIIEVRVFEVDLGTDPVRLTEIKSLDGDCIFISPCSSKSFRSCQDDDGVGGDRVYFIDGYLFPDKNARPFYKFVYSMEDGTVAPFPAGIPQDKLRAPDGVLLNPTWLFPPE